MGRRSLPEWSALELALSNEVIPCAGFSWHVWVAADVIGSIKTSASAHAHGDSFAKKIAESRLVKGMLMNFRSSALHDTCAVYYARA